MVQDEAFAAVLDKYLANPKLPRDPLAREFLKRCQSFSVKVGDNIYKYYRTGEGPTVILVHGVHSNLDSMLAIASDLVETGFRVVLFDLPAHGEASGITVDPIEIRALIRTVCDKVGEIRAFVGHSLGGMWGLAAVRGGVRTQAVVTIGAPATSRFIVEKFVALNDVAHEHAEQLAAELEERFGRDLWREYSASEIAKAIDVPGLIIHGKSDDFVPPGHAAQIGVNWRAARVELVDDVGHFDSALSPKVRDLVVSYLRQSLPAN